MNSKNVIQNKVLVLKAFYILMGISLFLIPLIDAWMFYPLGIENINTRATALGGILPWTDARGYYWGANHFLETGVLDAWNTRRPLNAILFSIRLWLTNNHFEAALVIQALLCGISCLLVTKSITQTFGKISGIATLFMLFLFGAVFIPTTLSETLGLTLGCLAFVFLWAAVQTQKSSLFFNTGLMLMAGLNARAGAFFILPLLIVWLGYHFRNQSTQKIHRIFNWKIAGIFTLGLLCGLFFNFVLIKFYADPTSTGGAMHGNFAATLYGLVSGGKTWNYAYTMFSSLPFKSEAEFAHFLYQQSFEQFKANPVLLLQGLLKGWFGPIESALRFFQFGTSHSLILKFFILLSGIFIFIYSIWRAIQLHKIYKTEIGLISTALFGMFLSAAVIWTDGQFRVFAVTVPFFAAAFGIILGALFLNTTQMQKKLPINKSTQAARSEIMPTYVLSYTLLIAAFIGPLFIKTVNMPDIASFACPKNETLLVTKNISGVPYVDLLKRSAEFKKTLAKNDLEVQKPFLKILEANRFENITAVGLVYDIRSADTHFIAAPLAVFQSQNKWVGLCTAKIQGIENTITQVKSYGALSEK